MFFIKKIKSSIKLCKEFGSLAPLMVFAVAAPGLGAMLLISSSNDWFPWLDSLNNWTLPAYVLLTIVFVGLSLLPTHASSLMGGMLFGLLQGPIYALCAILGASYLSFQIIRLLVKESSYKAILKRPRAAKIHEELLKRSGFKSVLFISLIRLSPVMPFAGTNVLLAASKVKMSHFLLGSFIGLAPRVVLVAVAGAGLAELDFSKNSNIGLAILGGVATLLLIFYVGLVFKKVNKKFLNDF